MVGVIHGLMIMTMLLHGALGCCWHHLPCEIHAVSPPTHALQQAAHDCCCGCHATFKTANKDKLISIAGSAAEKLSNDGTCTIAHSQEVPDSCPCEKGCGCQKHCVYVGPSSVSAGQAEGVSLPLLAYSELPRVAPASQVSAPLAATRFLYPALSAKATCARLRVWRL